MDQHPLEKIGPYACG